MGLLKRPDAAHYVPLTRPKMHQSRLILAKDLEGRNLQWAMELSDLAGKILNANQETTQRAIDEVGVVGEFLLLKLRKAPDPIGIAAGRNFLYEMCMGWAIAQAEVKKWRQRKGITHSIVNNGLVMYCTKAERNEYRDSLILALETGYYATRKRLDGQMELPEQVLSELY